MSGAVAGSAKFHLDRHDPDEFRKTRIRVNGRTRRNRARRFARLSVFAAAACGSLVTDNVGAQSVTNYSYDALGRLTGVTQDSSGIGQVTSSYAYDPGGNRSNAAVVSTSSGQPPGSGIGSGVRRAVVVPLNGYTVIPLP